jgi:glycosyltransferase involved in cell wall biosynthesis
MSCILCISDLFWDEHWSSEQQLMSRFADSCRVLYVERPVSLFSFFTGVADASVSRQFRRWASGGLRQEGRNLYVLTPPPCLPFRYSPVINRINQAIRLGSIKRAMERLDICKPVLWIYEPDAGAAVGKFDEVLSIYHCADDWSASRQWWNPAKRVITREKDLIKKASVVFVTSRKLFDDKKDLAKKIYYTPNGVSLNDFSKIADVPSDIKLIQKPIIGCAALYNHRYDYNLLFKIALYHKDWSFVFVGDLIAKGADIDGLRSLPNVYFLGNKSRSSLGSYIQYFDICLIPYKPSDFANSAFPLKLMEYFFFGKPVVSLRIPSIEEFSELAYQYDDEKGFQEAIERALVESDPVRSQQRSLLAQDNTWEKRVAEIQMFLQNHFMM